MHRVEKLQPAATIATTWNGFSVGETNHFDRWEKTACSSELPPVKGLRMHGAARWQRGWGGKKCLKINPGLLIHSGSNTDPETETALFTQREIREMDPCKRWRNSISDVYCQAAALTFCAGVIHEKLMGWHDDWWGCHSHTNARARTHTHTAFGFGVTVKSHINSTKRASCLSGHGDCYQDPDKHKHTGTQQTLKRCPSSRVHVALRCVCRVSEQLQVLLLQPVSEGRHAGMATVPTKTFL